MGERNRVGLLFSYNEEWIAGTYYVLNIIHALNAIMDAEKPVIVIISEDKKNYEIVKKETKYPYLEYFQYPVPKIKYTVLERAVNKIGITLLNKKFINKKPLKVNVDLIYPFQIDNITPKPIKKVNWIPDFQEVHLPQYFTPEIIAQRKKNQVETICKGDIVVFSSNDSQKDFNTLYPDVKVNRFVMPFAVSHTSPIVQNTEELLSKYGLSQKYFFAPNQFWAHKNHLVILDALKILKTQGKELTVAFSGKENDHRNSDHVALLKEFVQENRLESNIKFLGFIPREDQLALMQKSIAILQPSLFEGWSTVVEDAKSIHKHIVLSNIAIHKEQIGNGCTFFDPNEPGLLADILDNLYLQPSKDMENDYREDVVKFGKRFMELVEMAVN